jgi:Transposase DDE domain
VFGWWQHPDATLAQLSHLTTVLEESITPQGLDQRFGPAGAARLAERLETTGAPVITAAPVASGVLARFPAVDVVDSTTVALPDALATLWPGGGGRVPQGSQAALKLTLRLDMVRGGLDGPRRRAGRAQDKGSPLTTAARPGGALRIAAQGFWSLDVLTQIAAAGSAFLRRLHCQTTVCLDGQTLALAPWLRAQGGHALDVPLTLGKRAPRPVRLRAVRVPQAVAERRRAARYAAAQREGATPRARRLALTDWPLLVTNVPAAHRSLREALVLARVRWQIELLFKLWKSGGQLASFRSANPWRVLCEVYAKLSALVLQHWLLLVSCWGFADRSLGRAATTVRDFVVLLALGLRQRSLLSATLDRIRRCLATGDRIDNRKPHPSACQLLADPECGYA